MTNITDAEQIRDETAEGANTATRVGSCMVNIATDVAASTASVFSMENFGARLSMVDNATPTPVTTAGTYYKALGTTVETFAAGFTLTNNRMTYTTADSIQRAFRITAILSASCATGNHVYRARLAVNGQTDTATEVACHVTAGKPSQVGLEGFYVLGSGDYVEVFVTDEDNGEQLTVSHLQMAAQVYPINVVGSYCFEAQQLFARMPVQPSTTEKAAINTLFLDLKNPGYLARMDKLLVPRYAVDVSAAVLDWKGGSSASIHGSASWSAEFGFVGGGNSTGYINSHYNPATGATNFSLNSFSVGSFVTAAGTGDSDFLFGARGSTGTQLHLFESTGNSYEARACATTNTYTASNQVGTGLIVLQRTASNAVEIYKNGTGIATNNKNAASVSIPSFDLYICGNNVNGTASGVSTTKIGAWWAGDSFTPVEQATIKSAFDTYFNALA